jgi:WD40 repeat protein
VRYLPDGRLVTTGHNTLSIGERTIELPFQTLGPFVVDHRGVRAATVDRDGLLRIVELATGDVRIIGSALENHLLFADVAIDETGRWVAVQGKGHTVRVIDVQDASERSFATDAANLQFTSDSRWIVTGRMPDLHLFSVATGDVRAETVPVVHPGANGPMSADIVTGAGSTIAGIQYEGTVTVGDVLDPRSWWTIESSRPITTIAFSPDGALLGVGDIDGIVGVWRVKDRKRITSFDVGSTAHVVAFSLDGASCVVGTTQTSVLHSIPTGLQRKLYDRIAAGSLAFSPDGTRIAGLSEGLVREWPDDLPRDEAGLRAWIEQALR